MVSLGIPLSPARGKLRIPLLLALEHLDLLRGFNREQADAIFREHGAEIAIFNGYDRHVIGGSLPAIEHIKTAAEARAVLVNLVPVGVAAHTSLLAAASRGFEAELRRSALAARCLCWQELMAYRFVTAP